MKNRPWRILAGAYEIQRQVRREGRPATPREQMILALVDPTLTALEGDQTMGDYGRYRVREFRKVFGHAIS